jgi:hypothetical protein
LPAQQQRQVQWIPVSSVSWSGSRETIGDKGEYWKQKCAMTFVVSVIIRYAIDYKVVSAEGIEPSTY